MSARPETMCALHKFFAPHTDPPPKPGGGAGRLWHRETTV